MKKIHLYTDGGCQGNPGPGAWAAVAFEDGSEGKLHKLSGGSEQTTNNRMELQAMLEGLRGLEKGLGLAGEAFQLEIYTDSQYVKNGICTWIHSWKAKGWKTSSKQPVKNQDLWQSLDQVVEVVKRSAQINWHWVKGHSGNYYNELCDQLVKAKFPQS